MQHIQVILGMVADSGFRAKIEEVGFTGDWRPKFANAQGRFTGTSFIPDTFGEPVQSLYRQYHSNQTLWHGFDPDGKSTYAGDPFLDDLTTKMRREFDKNKRIQLAFDLQRYEGKKMYWPKVAGGANSFELAWPVLRNRDVWQGIGHRDFATWWLDPKKAPLGAS